MRPFDRHTGKAVAIDLANIDTDQIIPKQFLKRIERTGYGQFLFNDWRFNADGSAREDFPLNDPAYKNASILIAGANFGCGSSREHAPWSILDHGFRAVIAPSFADIFHNNSLKNGLLPITLPEDAVARLTAASKQPNGLEISIDLEEQSVRGENFDERFEINEFAKYSLLNGLDDIGLTLKNAADIERFEQDSVPSYRFAAF
ncbi:MAG: 3-isopropylmalate dehydratase small subunit [Acidobacteria bacterium]|nr:3-isopropylmalate dehydratase small subunit [Acidobacteriota bacterium]